MVTKEELLQNFVAKYVIKNKMVTVAGQLFIEFEKKLDNSTQIFKENEEYKCDNKIKSDILDRVFGDNVGNVL